MEERNIDTWEEFKTQLADLRRERKASREGDDDFPLLFRGQENSDWLLTTTLDRKVTQALFLAYYRMIGRLRSQIETLTGREWPLLEFPDVERLVQGYAEFSNALYFGKWPGYAYMAYLRHHGFPSPLLDWTRSAYVAAYFAFAI